MELLLSNIPPVRCSHQKTKSCFDDLFQHADSVRIASGYISTEALAELKKIVEGNKKSFLELLIGMHGFEGFTQSQIDAARYLDDYLRDKKIGQVRVVKAFKFHGKVYSFLNSQQTPFASIIGSSNLSSILDDQNHYETDLYFDEKNMVSEIDGFITKLSKDACVPLYGYEPKIIEGENTLLDNQEGVVRPTNDELKKVLLDKTKKSFKIPIKGSEIASKSSLNVFFGKGRKNKKGFVKPRHWYEVELMVPKEITDKPGYPKAGRNKKSIITVYTDDRWKFDCKISGDYSKNFRSTPDLKILGRWIKGRLENNGALKVGEPVTSETLRRYGRDDFELIATSNPAVWILDFGV
ncbi:MAG TPA: NgoFVII family restriction endonuclease [Candidatus Omnitrophota bacterium]|nr:NgoFVII family restriction endonuclease [Candidatus Omnitrophota bacterium]